MIGFSHRTRGFVFTLASVWLALFLSGCENDNVLNGIDVGLSPQLGTIRPCAPTVADAWAFSVSAGDEVMISVDTVSDATAADMELRGVCGTGDFFFADDNFLCTYPPPAFSCPATVFTATADGDCIVDVSPALTGLAPPTAACSDPDRADYELFVDRGGEPALLILVRGGSDTICMGGSNNSRSCTDDDDCPGGSCVPAASLESSLKQAKLP